MKQKLKENKKEVMKGQEKGEKMMKGRKEKKRKEKKYPSG
jgi:hypothetical protein